MNFIAEFGFDVKQGKEREFQRWLSDNEGKLAAAWPEGAEYLGTFGVIYSSEKHAGGYRQLVRLESYGTQDVLAETTKAGGELATLLDEMGQFVDQDRNANWSNGLYKAVTDLSLLSSA